jgi:acyl-CoA hydrolase
MSPLEQYRQKRVTAAEAVGVVRSGDSLIVPTGVGEPPELLAALSERRREWSDVKVSQILAMGRYGYIDQATASNVRHVALFFGGATRAGGQAGWIDFTPNCFSEIPSLIQRGLIGADVVLTMASAMDGHGYFSISLGTDYTMAAIAKARAVVLEVNPNVPFAGGNCHVHISQVTSLVESQAPVLEVGLPTIGPVQQAIGGQVAEMIPDGATLQIGYGGIPDAVVMQLTRKHDLGVHTEMLGDGLLTLVECGAITNRHKNWMPGKMIATFALGSQKLYRFMDRNPAVEMHPADFTNTPHLASRNDNLMSINATLQVDLLGQCGSESLGGSPYSGTGGQTDFVRAANQSRGGNSFIVLPSTAAGNTISRIVAMLAPGTHVTTGKNDVNYDVTEHGVAQLRGKSAKARAGELIAIAHPDFRSELRDQARHMGRL